MEKTYFEIKVTFIHILIMLVAVILIGVLLFYMGYKAGYRANPNVPGGEPDATRSAQTEAIESPQAIDEKPLFTGQRPAAAKQTEKEPPPKTAAAATAKPKTEATKPSIARFAIRVGAFSSQANAQNYAGRFERGGYRVKVVPPEPQAKAGLFYVLVGSFGEKEAAETEKQKLEKLENKKFIVVPYR